MITYNKSLSLQLAMAVDQAYQKYADPSHVILIPGYVLKDEIYVWESMSAGRQFLGYSAESTDGSGDSMIIFRGTVSIEEDIYDLEWNMTPCLLNGNTYGKVAYGWYDYYTGTDAGAVYSVQHYVRDAYKKLPSGGTLRIAGHSLGCAIAALSYLDIVTAAPLAMKAIEMYTFASPYVGDSNFVNSFKKHSSFGDIYRVSNLCDCVPAFTGLSILPNESYKHLGEDCNFIWQTGFLINNHSLDKTYIKALIKDMTMPGYVNLGPRAQPVPPC